MRTFHKGCSLIYLLESALFYSLASLRYRDGVRVVQMRMEFGSLAAMAQVLDAFKTHYNQARPHQSLNGQTPAMVWNRQVGKRLAKVQAKVEQTKPAVYQRSRAPPG